jgi:hypothetical protein
VKSTTIVRNGPTTFGSVVYESDSVPSVPLMPPPTRLSSNITDYVQLAGDQVVVVPDGNYFGGTVQGSHPATSGPFGGWLVLVAEHQHGVVVDMSSADLVLAAGTSRVLFVGFRFTNGRLFNQGTDIAYWYCDHTYPDYRVITADASVPRFLFIGAAERISIYGGDFHDGNASVLNISNARDVTVQGVHVWNVFEHSGTDPLDYSHANDISILAGNLANLTVKDSFFAENRNNHQARDGDITGLVYDNVWYTGAAGSAFQFHVLNGHRIEGSRTDVWSFDHGGRNPNDRIDTVDGITVPSGSSPRIAVSDNRVKVEDPPAGTVDPSTLWRLANPYTSWRDFFGWS